MPTRVVADLSLMTSGPGRYDISLWDLERRDVGQFNKH